MKNLIQKIFKLLGYQIQKFNPFPDTFVPINILDYIIFKYINIDKDLNCIVIGDKNDFEFDIINSSLRKYKIFPEFFLEFSNEIDLVIKKKNIKILIIRDNYRYDNFFKNFLKMNFYPPLIIMAINNKSRQEVYSTNMHMLNQGYGIMKFWSFAIYAK
jgi:hypothetical protein